MNTGHSTSSQALRAAFQEYLDAQRQFVEITETCSKRGWPDRPAVLYYAWECQRLYIRRQELRFEYLYAGGEFETGIWSSLGSVFDRLHKRWREIDESSALSRHQEYQHLTAEIAEAELSRASLDKELLDGPLRTVQGQAEYRTARQTIYEKVHELDERLGKLFAHGGCPESS
jgi:hypothetical protein